MRTLSFAVVMVGLAACTMPGKQTAQLAQTHLRSTDGKVSGTVTFDHTKQGLKVVAEVRGLKPRTVHGIHVHEHGKCEGPDFKTAGDHFNPAGSAHGHPSAPVKHPGDFGNLVADQNGRAKKEIMLDSSEVKNNNPFIGKAVILHTEADDLIGQPSGNAGERLACGIIQ